MKQEPEAENPFAIFHLFAMAMPLLLLLLLSACASVDGDWKGANYAAADLYYAKGVSPIGPDFLGP